MHSYYIVCPPVLYWNCKMSHLVCSACSSQLIFQLVFLNCSSSTSITTPVHQFFFPLRNVNISIRQAAVWFLIITCFQEQWCEGNEKIPMYLPGKLCGKCIDVSQIGLLSSYLISHPSPLIFLPSAYFMWNGLNGPVFSGASAWLNHKPESCIFNLYFFLLLLVLTFFQVNFV